MPALASRRFVPVLRPSRQGPWCHCIVCGTDYLVSEAPRRCAKVPPVAGVIPCHEVTGEDYTRATGRAPPR